MEELLKTSNYKFHGLRKGQTVEGIVTDIKGKTVMMDIGAKTEGVVISKEYEETAELMQKLKLGDRVRVVIYSPENDSGQILLSMREAVNDYKWDLFDQYIKTSEAVEVRGLEINRGGLIARILGVRGFIPASQFGSQYLGKLDTLQNKILKVKVIEVDREKNRLIFSEKAVSEAAALAQKQKALKKVKIGETYTGIVSGVMPFGIFVRVEVDPSPSTGSGSGQGPSASSGQGMFLEGLVHISELSWEKVDDVNKFYRVGDKVKVKVLGADEASAKLNLSVKQLLSDPWVEAVKKYPVDKKVKGEITRLASFGAFVALEPGVEGLIHISKIPSDMEIAVGKKVDIYVEAVEPQKRRMSLGLVLTEKPVGYK
jgi:ribosomal protein S1